MVSWKANFYLDKGKNPRYFPSEDGSLSITTIKNTGENRIHISQITIKFDWQGDKYWYKNWTAELDPDESTNLPPIGFTVPIDVSLGSHTYKFGIKVEEWIGSNWVDSGILQGKKTHHLLIGRYPKRDFRVFISHSNRAEDEKFVNMIHDSLENCGFDAYVAEREVESGGLWPKLEREIRRSDALLVFWTRFAVISRDVREEIGISVGAGMKPEQIVIIKEGALRGSLIGNEYASFNRGNPKQGILDAIKMIIKQAEKKPRPPAAASE